MTENKLIVFGVVLLVMYAMTNGLIIADLWAGVRKARILGVLRTSEGYKRTVDKVSRYNNMLMGLTFMDGIQVALCYAMADTYEVEVMLLPWFTFLGAVYAGFVEIKSILEPASDKERRQMREVVVLAEAIMKHKTEPEEIAKAVAEYLGHDVARRHPPAAEYEDCKE